MKKVSLETRPRRFVVCYLCYLLCYPCVLLSHVNAILCVIFVLCYACVIFVFILVLSLCCPFVIRIVILILILIRILILYYPILVLSWCYPNVVCFFFCRAIPWSRRRHTTQHRRPRPKSWRVPYNDKALPPCLLS